MCHTSASDAAVRRQSGEQQRLLLDSLLYAVYGALHHQLQGGKLSAHAAMLSAGRGVRCLCTRLESRWGVRELGVAEPLRLRVLDP